jgi:fatty acid desaturase
VAERHVSTYSELLRRIQGADLLRRRRGWYWRRIAATVAAFAAVWVGVFLVGNSWYQLLLAAAFGVVLTQVMFLSHDGAHRQMFASHKWNEWVSMVLGGIFGGLSYGWWMHKHNTHHGSPNEEGRDPDIGDGVVAFTPEVAAGKRGVGAWIVRHQGWLFIPLLLLEGLNLHIASIQVVTRRTNPVKHAGVERAFIAARLGAYIVVLLLVMSPGKAAAFVGLQLAVFGLLLGGAFVPNHTGMPIVPARSRIDFLRRQVLMSRNIRGGWLVDLYMGGLNYQIEHHLFPNMPRVHLRKAQPIVAAYCRENGIDYTESGLWASYRTVLRYLNRVGIGARDPFDCPLRAQLR